MQKILTQLGVTRVAGVAFLYSLAAGLACVAWVATLLIVLLLVTTTTGITRTTVTPKQDAESAWRRDRFDAFNLLPTNDPELVAMKRQLAGDRTNAVLQDAIRERDAILRSDYFTRRGNVAVWGWLLLGSVAVGLIASKTATTLARKLPIPTEEARSGIATKLLTQCRAGLVLFAAVGVGVFIGLAFTQPLSDDLYITPSPKDTATVSANPTTPVTPATHNTKPAKVFDREAFTIARQENWIAFRNDGSGLAAETVVPYPTSWDTTTGAGVAWQLPLPLPGNSSPILWGDRIFLTAADETRRVVLCVDTAGKQLWEREVPTQVASIKVDGDTGYAAPTPATDGERVYAIFATGDLVACDMNGEILWQKAFGLPDSHYGYAASLAVWFDRVIVQYDVGDGTGSESQLVCLAGASGETLWSIPRSIPNSWASPIIATISGREQIITAGDPFVIAYSPVDGRELWRCQALSGDVGPSPIAFDKYVIVTNQSPRTTMIDATGEGDVTATHIVWRGSNSLPDTSSPLAIGNNVFTLSSSGYLTCYQTETVANQRAAFWELELGDGFASFYSSPTEAGGLIYCFDMTADGAKAYAVDPSKASDDASGQIDADQAAAMIVGISPMAEPCVASPIFHRGRIYIRGQETFWCLGEK